MNRRLPLVAYYIIGGIALIGVFIIQIAGKMNRKCEYCATRVPDAGSHAARKLQENCVTVRMIKVIPNRLD